MKEKRFTLFWKKLIVMDLGLIVIIIRILNMIIGFLTKMSTNISIFPKQNENGYPFFESINCDIRELGPIIDSITAKKENETDENYENQDKIIFNSFINNFKSQQCAFIDKLNICSDNKKCFNELNNIKLDLPNDNISFNYHSSNNEGKLKISNLIHFFLNKNEFSIDKNEYIEIDTFYKLISGYQSFLNIKFYEKKKNNYDILKEITNHEEKVNNLLYFHSLFLKAQSLLHKNKISSKEESIKYINQCLSENEDQFTLKKSFFNTYEKNKQKMIDIIENDLSNIINCIPDFNSRYSYSVDLQAIKTMIKLLLGIDSNKLSRSDKKILNFFLKEISKGIKNIFIADVEIRKKANIYEKYQPYFMTVFICIALGGLIFTNRYFIKNREYYNQSSRLLEKYKRERYNHMYNNKHHQYWAKMKEMENKRKEEEMKNTNNDEKNKNDKNKNNNGNDNKKSEISGDKDKCTKEELEYIKKLADEHKGDFILSK